MKITVAENRRKEVDKLAGITGDFAVAKNLMNRYYRLAGLDERLLYLENNENTANTAFTRDIRIKRDKMLKSLNTDFKKYGLMLVYYGYIATITDKEGNNEKIYTFFYN